MGKLNNKSLVITALFCVLWLACGFGLAKAAYQDPALNAAASTIAGKPVIVSCPESIHEWAQFEDIAGFKFEVEGFTYVGRDNVIFLAAEACKALVADLRYGPTAVGDYWNGLAIRALVHEATHQRLNSGDETLVDCTTLATIRSYLPLFGYTPTVTRVTYVKLKSGTYRRVSKVVPNPATASVMQWITFWDSYHAVC